MVKLALIDTDKDIILDEVEVPSNFSEEQAINLDKMLRKLKVLPEHQELVLIDFF